MKMESVKETIDYHKTDGGRQRRQAVFVKKMEGK
jgi:hypothetical protein